MVRSPRAVLGSFLAFAGIAVVVSVQNQVGAVTARLAVPAPPFSIFFGHELPVWLSWWLLLPLIGEVRRRFRPTGGPALVLACHWLVHLGAGLVFGYLSMALIVASRVYIWYHRDYGEFWSRLAFDYPQSFALQLLIYTGIVAVLEGLILQREARRRARREEALRADLAEARLDGIRARLQPHFLFNTLTAISSLMSRDVGAARTALARLSDLLRGVLDDDETSPTIPLRQELVLLERYVDLIRLRFGDRLRLVIDAPVETRPLHVPRLVLQPLVENAVVHGIERRRDASQIEVSARLERDRLTLVVTDDGPGPPPNPREGIGLGATRARLDTLYGDAARLRLDHHDGGGALVEVWLPAEST
ncbi:MAG: histidine kinase [Acidobacteriota bacterium]